MTRNGLANIINSLGQPVSHQQAKAPGTVTAVARCLTQSTSKAPDPIVQAYGVNGREFVFMDTALSAPPERFDFVTLSGERYTLDVAIPLHEESTGSLMGWRCYAKGK